MEQIRFATIQDMATLAPAIAVLVNQIPYYNDLAKKHETDRYKETALIEKIQDDSYSVIISAEANTVAGFCLSRFDDYTIWLEWFGVMASFRGKDISRQLLQKLEDTVTVRGCHKIWCDCRTSNEASVHILTSCGYRQIAALTNHWYGQDFILWEKFVDLGS